MSLGYKFHRSYIAEEYKFDTCQIQKLFFSNIGKETFEGKYLQRSKKMSPRGAVIMSIEYESGLLSVRGRIKSRNYGFPFCQDPQLSAGQVSRRPGYIIFEKSSDPQPP